MSLSFWARIDSGTANNPALNLTVDPAIYITFQPSGPNGDMTLEYNGGNPDPDTEVVINGQAYSFTFELVGNMPTAKNDGAQQVPDQFEGDTTYVVTVHDYPAPGDSTRLMYLPYSNATEAEMNDFGNGAIDLQNLDTTPPDLPVCFASGTLIRTPSGEVPVESLSPGDLVMTVDRGPQPVIWTAQSTHRWPGSPEEERPVLIRAGALGPDLPATDLVVSPQHRIAIPGEDRLAPAKGLVELPGIRIKKGCRRITYHHVLLSRHELVISNGLASESFFPGPTALTMLGPIRAADLSLALARHGLELETAFPQKVRPCLTVGEATRWARARKHAHKGQEPVGLTA